MTTHEIASQSLPIRVVPQPEESLNSIVRRAANANYVPTKAITGSSGKYFMDPKPAVLKCISARLSIASEDLLRHTAPAFAHRRSGFLAMCLNTRRLQYCALCADQTESRYWYLPTSFACTRCRVLLTNGCNEQLPVSARALNIQNQMTEFATTSTARTTHVMGHFDRMYRDLMRRKMHRLRDPEAIALAEAVELSGRDYENHGMIPIHPPTTAVAALELWQKSRAKPLYRYWTYCQPT
ncbi:hypothetical protein GOACH_15_01090 [Gordonia aichiensis NBRC 108223]|uniref:TniQ domain-containing protein n=1 Tax=Gordonia aichiensis NBRC 108223 TaxID=1220583 RepID=L7KM88_9ACTN|nr:hypothetical protein GOACH_15_01090 [Gordonia aichiensis NBRC 108223]